MGFNSGLKGLMSVQLMVLVCTLRTVAWRDAFCVTVERQYLGTWLKAEVTSY